jgi:hypothetical protein
MKLNKDDRREEMAAYGTIILISVVLTLIIAAVVLTLIIAAIISNLLN